MQVALGTKVKDSITGFEGIAIARTTYMNGCVHVCVQPKALHEGKPIEAQWFDEQRLTDKSPATTGGPSLSPPPPRPC